MQHIRKLTEAQILYEVVGEEPDLAPKFI
jgi:hypothetical protein